MSVNSNGAMSHSVTVHWRAESNKLVVQDILINGETGRVESVTGVTSSDNLLSCHDSTSMTECLFTTEEYEQYTPLRINLKEPVIVYTVTLEMGAKSKYRTRDDILGVVRNSDGHMFTGSEFEDATANMDVNSFNNAFTPFALRTLQAYPQDSTYQDQNKYDGPSWWGPYASSYQPVEVLDVWTAETTGFVVNGVNPQQFTRVNQPGDTMQEWVHVKWKLNDDATGKWTRYHNVRDYLGPWTMYAEPHTVASKAVSPFVAARRGAMPAIVPSDVTTGTFSNNLYIRNSF